MGDLTDVPASLHDRKTVARPFDTIHDILQCLSLVQSLLKDQNAPIWRKREPTRTGLSGSDGLNTFSTKETKESYGYSPPENQKANKVCEMRDFVL